MHESIIFKGSEEKKRGIHVGIEFEGGEKEGEKKKKGKGKEKGKEHLKKRK